MSHSRSPTDRAQPASRAAAGQGAGPEAAPQPIDASPALAAQRRQIDSAFGEAAQRQEEPNRTGMPDALKSGIESLSGMDMSDVRVHRNSPQPRQLNALAYAQGNEIHVGPGQEKHLPHEAWHIVQQRQGRVQATQEVGGVPVNDDVQLEQEADVMGSKALAQRGGKGKRP